MNDDTKLNDTDAAAEGKLVCYLYKVRGKNWYKIGLSVSEYRHNDAFVTEDWVRLGGLTERAREVETEVKRRLARFCPPPFPGHSKKTEQFLNLTDVQLKWLESLGFPTDIPTYNHRGDLDPNGQAPVARWRYWQFLGMALLQLEQTPKCYWRFPILVIQLTTVGFMSRCQYDDGKFLLGPADYAVVDDIHAQGSPEPRCMLHTKFAMTEMVDKGLTEYVGTEGFWGLTYEGVGWASEFFHSDQLKVMESITGFYRQNRRTLRVGIDTPTMIQPGSIFGEQYTGFSKKRRKFVLAKGEGEWLTPHQNHSSLGRLKGGCPYLGGLAHTKLAT